MIYHFKGKSIKIIKYAYDWVTIHLSIKYLAWNMAKALRRHKKNCNFILIIGKKILSMLAYFPVVQISGFVPYKSI